MLLNRCSFFMPLTLPSTNLNSSSTSMVSLCKFLSLSLLILLIKPIFSQQSYDRTSCNAIAQVPGTNYLCTRKEFSCHTYIVYRAQNGYQTLSSIASLFSTSLTPLLSSNNMSHSTSENLKHGQEIIVPVTCSCPDRFSRAVFGYNASQSDSLSKVACGVYEGLVKAPVLMEENPNFNGSDPNSSLLRVPIRCACPDGSDTGNGTNFLVTYPVIEEDDMSLIALKFGVPESLILHANRLDSFAAIFPQTTLLIPTRDKPVLKLDVAPEQEDPSPSPRSIVDLDIFPGAELKTQNLPMYLGVGLSGSFILMVLVCGPLVFIWRRNHPSKFQSLFVSSPLPNFSPDLLDGMSKLKHSLVRFSLDELRIATEDFSQATAIGTSMFRGRIGSSYLAIEQMNSEEEARNVIAILTKINHLNVVKLEGCCYGSRPCLVYEFVKNGSLRDCLSNVAMSKQLKWATRMQIAFDLAVGLHYIHHCTKPAYVHQNINSRNILITTDWRAKISGFRLAKPLICVEEVEELNWNESVLVGRKGYLAPEYLTYGQAPTKLDVYAFGVVLLELLSAKEACENGNYLLKDCSIFAGGAVLDSSGSLEKLKKFMDPSLEGDYTLGDAMCLALLAKGCLEENPLHRPTMDDVLKALSRILR